MKKRIVLFMMVLLLAVSMAVFAGGEKESGGAKTVGYALWTMEYTFFQNLEKGVKDACAELGYEYIMLDQNSDPGKMVQDICYNNAVAYFNLPDGTMAAVNYSLTAGDFFIGVMLVFVALSLIASLALQAMRFYRGG